MLVEVKGRLATELAPPPPPASLERFVAVCDEAHTACPSQGSRLPDLPLCQQAGSPPRLRPSSSPQSRGSRLLTLRFDRPLQFINRANALSLYRQFIRATRSLGDAGARWETIEWVRGDFERYRGVVESVSTSQRCYPAQEALTMPLLSRKSRKRFSLSATDSSSSSMPPAA